MAQMAQVEIEMEPMEPEMEPMEPEMEQMENEIKDPETDSAFFDSESLDRVNVILPERHERLERPSPREESRNKQKGLAFTIVCLAAPVIVLVLTIPAAMGLFN